MNDDDKIVSLDRFREETPPQEHEDGWGLYDVETVSGEHFQLEGILAITSSFVAVMADQPGLFNGFFPVGQVKQILRDDSTETN